MAATLNERIAQRLREAVRAADDLTEEALGLHAGISERTMRRRMTGKVKWNTDELDAIATALGCSVSSLVDEQAHSN